MYKLHIVVPYRDRASHLERFIPHLRAYFARDVLARGIDYRVTIVEQQDGAPFNSGVLKNIGFLLGEGECSHTCFHDVDYLPVWADYTAAEVPTPLVWWGAETRPIAPGKGPGVVRHDLDLFFGAAVLVPNGQHRAVNGYSNDFWGWGFEDEDLKRRFVAQGIEPSRRRGTYMALDHENQGFFIDGSLRPIVAVNRALMDGKWFGRPAWPEDGLSSLSFDILERRPVPSPAPERPASWEIVKVRPGGRPSAAQIKALASPRPAFPAGIWTAAVDISGKR